MCLTHSNQDNQLDRHTWYWMQHLIYMMKRLIITELYSLGGKICTHTLFTESEGVSAEFFLRYLVFFLHPTETRRSPRPLTYSAFPLNKREYISDPLWLWKGDLDPFRMWVNYEIGILFNLSYIHLQACQGYKWKQPNSSCCSQLF